jgi:hypothetical protein
LLAGYGKYPRSLLNWRGGGAYAALAPEAVRGWVRDRVLPRLPGRRDGWRSGRSSAMPHTPESTFFDNFAGIRRTRLQELLDPACTGPDATPTRRRAPGWIDARPGTPLLDRVLYADLKTYLVELLMKQDQMSMAASIESRVPFLDHKLVEFAATAAPLGGSSRGSPRSACCARRPCGPAAARDPRRARRWASRYRSGSGPAAPWHSIVRDVLLDRARASAACRHAGGRDTAGRITRAAHATAAMRSGRS